MKVIKWLDKHFEETLLVIFLVVMVVIMGTQVAARYVFNNSLTWSEELTRYMFVWSAFISISYCVRYEISIRIVQIKQLLPPVPEKIVSLVVLLAMMVFIFVLFRASLNVVQSSLTFSQKSSAMRIEMYYIQFSTVLGFCLTEIRLLQRVVKLFKGKVEDHS